MEAGGKGDSDYRRPANCGYYLRQKHDLIHRHVETIELDHDDTAHWELRIDFELPTHPESYWHGDNEPGEESPECIFLFPIVYLEKSDIRTGFEVRQEDGAELTIPTREECDLISAEAAIQAVEGLLAELKPPRPVLEADDLKEVFHLIAREKPLDASMLFDELRRQHGLTDLDETSSPEEETADPLARFAHIWQSEGLADVVRMLVEHTLVWLPIRGRPGERRSIVLAQEKALVPRSFLRWVVADLKRPRRTRAGRWLAATGPGRWWEARKARNSSKPTLELGEKRYGRRAYRVSFSALAEWIGRPLAWNPLELQIATVYTKRCRSYHFELICPPGRTPRDLRVAVTDDSTNTPLRSEPNEQPAELISESTGRTTLTSRRARHDRPGSDFRSNVWFRVSVGIGNGEFPALWPFAGIVTAVMLWIFAGNNPTLESSQAEIGAAILLGVPVLIAGLAFGSSEVPVARLLGGARTLLLIAGLSAVFAAAVIGGARPFGLRSDWIWTVCAITATVATFPLATAWLLSNSFVWLQMKRLRSRRLQKEALWIVVILALIGIDALVILGSASLADGMVAVYLLAVGIGATVLASNRAAMPIEESRRYVAFSFLIVGITCLALACIELRAAIDEGPGPQLGVEVGAFVLVLASLKAGDALSWVTARGGIAPSGGEIHVSPSAGRALLAKETVQELAVLRKREENEDLEKLAAYLEFASRRDP